MYRNYTIDYLTKSLGLHFFYIKFEVSNEYSVDLQLFERISLISVIYTDTENFLFFIH